MPVGGFINKGVSTMNHNILWLLMPNSTCFSPYLLNTLENKVFKTTQVAFKDTSVVLTVVFYVMQAVDTQNKEERKKMGKQAVF